MIKLLRRAQSNAILLRLPTVVFGVALAIACRHAESFECPDEQSVRLLEFAMRSPLSSEDTQVRASPYIEVIEAAARPMDEVALTVACRNYARIAYINSHAELGKTLHFYLVPPQQAVDSLLSDHPILQRCPQHALYSAYLPVRRPLYEPPAAAVSKGLTGWVDLEVDLDDSGSVERAIITASSNPILETGVVNYVRQFRYPSVSDPTHADMPRNSLSLRVTTDYFDIARAKGCVWRDPRRPVLPAA